MCYWRRIRGCSGKSNRIYGVETVEQIPDLFEQFGEQVKEMCDRFNANHKFKNKHRYFDDYWEVLLSFLPVMPFTLGQLSKIIIPFRVENLFIRNGTNATENKMLSMLVVISSF